MVETIQRSIDIENVLLRISGYIFIETSNNNANNELALLYTLSPCIAIRSFEWILGFLMGDCLDLWLVSPYDIVICVGREILEL